MATTPEELAKILHVELEIARALLASTSTQVPRKRTSFVRGLILVAVLLCGGVVFASARSGLVSLLFATNPPLAGEYVPRQIPYRGYLEEDGVAVNAQQVFSFRLEYGDGGVAWLEPSVSLPVFNGHFEVALGDSASNPIPGAVFDSPHVELFVSVSGQQIGHQRLLSVPYASRSDTAVNGVPVGTIIAFAGDELPPGWLPCDGSPRSVAAFPKLAAVLLPHWGSPASGSFSLPDLRGRFLRGMDLGSGRDPDSASRVDTSGTPVGDQVGSLELESFSSHTHTVVDPGHNHTLRRGFLIDANGGYGHGGPHYGGADAIDLGLHVINGNVTGISLGSSGGMETRPTNVLVRYIVKF